MQRVTIVDRNSGCPLYDYIKLWKEDARDPSTPAKIIHLFAHIAKTLKEDQVTRVIFEPAVDSEKKPKKKHNYNYNSHRYTGGLSASAHAAVSRHGTTSNPLMLAYRQPTLQSVRTRTLEMWCYVSTNIVAALFVSPEHFKDDPRVAVQEVAERFEEVFAQQLSEFQPQFLQMSHDTEEARNDLTFIPHFASFKMGLSMEEQDDTNSRMTSPLPQQRPQSQPLLLSMDLPNNYIPSDRTRPLDKKNNVDEYDIHDFTSSNSNVKSVQSGEDDDPLDRVVQETLGERLIQRLEQGSAAAAADTDLDDQIILATVKHPTSGGKARPSRQERTQSTVTIREDPPTMLSDIALSFPTDDDDNDMSPNQAVDTNSGNDYLLDDEISQPQTPALADAGGDLAFSESLNLNEDVHVESNEMDYGEFDAPEFPLRATSIPPMRATSPLITTSQSNSQKKRHSNTSLSNFDD